MATCVAEHALLLQFRIHSSTRIYDKSLNNVILTSKKKTIILLSRGKNFTNKSLGGPGMMTNKVHP